LGGLRWCSEDVGSGSIFLDSANAVAVAVDGNPGEAFLTPPCVPRVLDNVVAGGVADDSHAVVVVKSTGTGIVDDTFLVVVEDGLTSSDSHGGRTTGDSSLETFNREFGDVGFALNRNASAVSLASSFFTRKDVGVLACFCDLGAGSIDVDGSGVAATASVASGVAVKDLLLGEGDKLSALLLPRAFNASNGGESPA